MLKPAITAPVAKGACPCGRFSAGDRRAADHWVGCFVRRRQTEAPKGMYDRWSGISKYCESTSESGAGLVEESDTCNASQISRFGAAEKSNR